MSARGFFHIPTALFKERKRSKKKETATTTSALTKNDQLRLVESSRTLEQDSERDRSASWLLESSTAKTCVSDWNVCGGWRGGSDFPRLHESLFAGVEASDFVLEI